MKNHLQKHWWKYFLAGVIVGMLLIIPAWRWMQPINMIAHSQDAVVENAQQEKSMNNAGTNKDSGSLIDKAMADEVSGEVVDVGYSQGYIDWEALAPNISGAILECGYGSDFYDQDDYTFAHNVSECERLGIPYGVYLYSYAANDGMAESEANHVLRLIDGHNPALGVWYDLEEGGLEYYYCQAANVFCPIIQNAGYSTGVYSGAYNLRSTGLAYQGWQVWAASYGVDWLNIDVDVAAWQYTNSGIWGYDTSHWYGISPATGGNGSWSGGSDSPSPSYSGNDVRYQVETQSGNILPEMVGQTDTGGSSDWFAGVQGDPIIYLAIDMPGWYQAGTEANPNGLPVVYSYNIADTANGCAGDGSPIIWVRAYYDTPDPSSTGWISIYYAVSPLYSDFLPTMQDATDTGGSSDDFAGNYTDIDRFTAYLAAA